MTRHTILLFATPEILLGEVVAYDGAYVHLTLTDAGEQRMGTQAIVWQAQGNDTQFEAQLQQWCAAQHITTVVLSNAVQVDYWHKLLQLPLTPAHRFTMLQDLASANADELIAWQDFLTRVHT